MLGLTLREEFRGKRLKGTAIELSNDTNTGATQIAAQEFLEITYPTHDLLKGIEAVGPNQGRPVVVIGERGQLCGFGASGQSDDTRVPQVGLLGLHFREHFHDGIAPGRNAEIAKRDCGKKFHPVIVILEQRHQRLT